MYTRQPRPQQPSPPPRGALMGVTQPRDI
ncbi:hypothetical protein E2C01_077805 [Portunus trituberculatus]|uniref:Uncharacterized protein n=1 Tax=Portunus trituberculatus TaxID=210409 RepID=A0A5B7IL49_PORTR|nr:hypothetical protein [Portunus trituberculatus]